MRLLVTGLVFLSAVGLFVWFGLVEASVPVLALHDVAKKAPEGECRIEGGTVHSIESLSPSLRFTVSAKGDTSFVLPVESDEALPPNFKVGISVSVRGTYQAGKFVAVEVQTQCPSRYEASKSEGAPAVPSSMPPISTDQASTARTDGTPTASAAPGPR